jgi:hypothetical protein
MTGHHRSSPKPLRQCRRICAGWWIGRTLGGAAANFDFSQSSTSIDSSGVLGGITGGWNWQNGPIVIGFEEAGPGQTSTSR